MHPITATLILTLCIFTSFHCSPLTIESGRGRSHHEVEPVSLLPLAGRVEPAASFPEAQNWLVHKV